MPDTLPPMRPVGDSGVSISPLVFGGNVFRWTADRATSFALLDAASAPEAA